MLGSFETSLVSAGTRAICKKGEEQYGVDIFDTHGEDPMYGAQCKLKEQWKSLAPKEIREEIEKAKTFPSKLDHYAILTTGKISGDAQLEIQAINREHRASGLFTDCRPQDRDGDPDKTQNQTSNAKAISAGHRRKSIMLFGELCVAEKGWVPLGPRLIKK